MGEYINTEERAMKRLLEQCGYIIYEITYINELFKINGERSDIEFTVGVSVNPELREGDSLLGRAIEVIDNDIANVLELMTSMKEKKEFKIKKYADNVLIDMFEEGMMNGESVYVGSEVVGRAQGKTSTIVYLSKKYGIPVVVSGYPFDSVIKGYDKSLEVYSINTSVVTGIKSRIVLVDEIETRHARRLKEMGYVVIGIVR